MRRSATCLASSAPQSSSSHWLASLIAALIRLFGIRPKKKEPPIDMVASKPGLTMILGAGVSQALAVPGTAKITKAVDAALARYGAPYPELRDRLIARFNHVTALKRWQPLWRRASRSVGRASFPGRYTKQWNPKSRRFDQGSLLNASARCTRLSSPFLRNKFRPTRRYPPASRHEMI